MSRPAAGRVRGGPVRRVSIPLVMSWDIFLRRALNSCQRRSMITFVGHRHPQCPCADLEPLALTPSHVTAGPRTELQMALSPQAGPQNTSALGLCPEKPGESAS